MLDPITGSPTNGKTVHGIMVLHVDGLFFTGDAQFEKNILGKIRGEYQVGSEDKDDVVFTGQRVRWRGKCVVVDQDKAIEELTEITIDIL